MHLHTHVHTCVHAHTHEHTHLCEKKLYCSSMDASSSNSGVTTLDQAALAFCILSHYQHLPYSIQPALLKDAQCVFIQLG